MIFFARWRGALFRPPGGFFRPPAGRSLSPAGGAVSFAARRVVSPLLYVAGREKRRLINGVLELKGLGGFPAGRFDQRTAGRWSGQMGGWGSGPGVGGGWVRDGRGRAGGFTSNALRRTTLANPRSAQELFVQSTKALPLARICYRSRGSFGLRACSPPCPNSPGLTSRPASPGPLPRRSSFVICPPTRGGQFSVVLPP